MEPISNSRQIVSYQIPRNEIIRILFLRLLRRPGFIGVLIFLLLLTVYMFYHNADYSWVFVGLILLIFLWQSYRRVVRIVDQTPSYTELKTLAFGETGLVFTGSNSRVEYTWKFFRACSENAAYFYLSTSPAYFGTAIPKSAFTLQQQDEFRRCASAILKS
jgi:hypothetical protein